MTRSQTAVMQLSDKKIFGTLFFSMFSCLVGVGIVVPLLPVYAHNLGATGIYISMIFGSFSISRTILLPYFGKLSDEKGRKPFITTGLFAYTLISFAFMLSDTVNHLIIIRFIQGIASAMIMPVTQAYVGDITPKGSEGSVMGIFNISTFLSLSVGPLLGGMINQKFSLSMTFFCMAVLSFMAFLLSYLFLPSTASEYIERQSDTHRPDWRMLLKDRGLLGLFIYRFMYTACIGIIWGFFPVYADTHFKLSSFHIGLLMMTGVLTNGMVQVLFGYLADRFNKVVLIIIGGCITAFSLFSFLWAQTLLELFYDCFLFGLGGGIAMPSIMAIAVIKGKKKGVMGAVMALITMAHSAGMLAGALIAGVIMDVFELQYAFPFGAFIMILGIFGICLSNDHQSSKTA